MPKLQNAWTAEELAANRRGELPASQLAKIVRRDRRMLGALAVILGITFGGMGGGIAAILGAAAASIALGALGGIIVAAALVALGSSVVAPARGVPTEVVAVTGVLAAQDVYGYRNQRRIYTVAGTPVDPLYPGLEPLVGRQVTAYKLPDSRLVIAAEPAPESARSAAEAAADVRERHSK